MVPPPAAGAKHEATSGGDEVVEAAAGSEAKHEATSGGPESIDYGLPTGGGEMSSEVKFACLFDVMFNKN